MSQYPEHPDPMQRAIDYLHDNDYHEGGSEGEMARELARLREQITQTVQAADHALHDAAEFTGRVAEHSGPDAEEINAPFNDGGSGYEAHKKLWALRDRLSSSG